MKKKGSILIEIIISLALFMIMIFPMMKFSYILSNTNNRMLNLEREQKNFIALNKILSSKKYSELKHYLNKNTQEDDFIKNISLPYEIDKNTKIEVEISEIIIFSEKDEYNYLEIKTQFLNPIYKKFESKIIVGDLYEK